MLDVGGWALGTGHWTLDGCWMGQTGAGRALDGHWKGAGWTLDEGGRMLTVGWRQDAQC